MITDISKKILRDKMQLIKEDINAENAIINELDLRIGTLSEEKQVHVDRRKKLQDDLRDMKSDTEDTV